MCFFCTFWRQQWPVDTISSQTIENVRVVFQTNVLWNRIRYPCCIVGNTQSFNPSCNSQENDTAAARTPPQVSDLAVVLSRPTGDYIFLKRGRQWCVKCSAYVELSRLAKHRGGSSLPVSPQSAKINLLASWVDTWPFNPRTVGSLLSTLSFLSPWVDANAQRLHSQCITCHIFN